MSFLFGGGGAPQSKQTPALSGVQFQTSVYGKCIPIVYGTNRLAPNVIWYGDFKVKKHHITAGKGGVVGGSGGGKGGGSGVTYTYKTSVAYGICEGPIQGYGNVYIDKNVTTTAAQGFTTFTGTYPQTAWTYLSTNHPTQAIGYNGIAYAAVSDYDLGNSANIPNNNFEIRGLYSNSVGALPDADPSLVITDILTNAYHGAGFPASRLGSLTTYQAYTLATGLLISPVYTSQQQASSMVEDICKNTNSAAVWSEGLLTIVPYGDVSATGNGKTYTPPSSPIYDLNDNDFIAQNGQDPVVLNRKRQSDSMNALKMEYADSSNNYNTASIDVKDQTSIDLYGLRQDTSNNARLYTNATAAQQAAQLLLYRQAIRNVYNFVLDQRYILLDPMDIVTLTDTNLGLNKQWVRILTIEEQDDYSLSITAEEYLSGTGSPATSTFASGSGYTTNYNADPGAANTPIIFDAPVQLASNGGLETWIATSGVNTDLWGGCEIWISSDNVTYKLAVRQNGPSRMGVLSADLPSHADPDTADTLSVTLLESAGELSSGTQSDADLGNTICYVDGELISYETATLTGTNAYDLTYLRRGFFKTPIGAHLTGTSFARLDEQVSSYPFTKDQIGTTIYIKILGFNIYGGGLQSLGDVSPYTHVITGPTEPDDVTNFAAKQNGNTVVFRWDPVNDFALEGYYIGYATLGETNWNNFSLLTEAMKGTEMTNANVPPGDWTFGIRAKDIADQYSDNITTYDLLVENLNPTITEQEQAPDFPGTCNGFVRHWTGKIVPQDQFAASHYGFELFDSMVPNPIALSEYTTPTYDVGYDTNFRIFETNEALPGYGESGTATPTVYLDAWITGVDPGTYVPWTIGSVDFRYANMKISYAAVAGSVNYIDEFSFTIDAAPVSSTSPITQVIAAAGTTITFPTSFHTPPFVNPVVQGTSGLYANVSSVTTTTAVIHVYNAAGADVGGTVTWTATGN